MCHPILLFGCVLLLVFFMICLYYTIIRVCTSTRDTRVHCPRTGDTRLNADTKWTIIRCRCLVLFTFPIGMNLSICDDCASVESSTMDLVCNENCWDTHTLCSLDTQIECSLFIRYASYRRDSCWTSFLHECACICAYSTWLLMTLICPCGLCRNRPQSASLLCVVVVINYFVKSV